MEENSAGNEDRKLINPGTMIMWMLGSEVEDEPSKILFQANDMALAGFSGVILTPRAARSDLRSQAMFDILKKAADAARNRDLDVVIMADPRLASESLIRETGEAQDILLINRTPANKWDGRKLNTSEIIGGSFSWKIDYPLHRLTHMIMSGAITYSPSGIARVYAVRRSDKNQVREFTDITAQSELKHDSNSHSVEIIGNVPDNLNGWEVIAFPIFRTNFFDYTGLKSWKLWEEFMERLVGEIDGLSGVAWDEPGFYAEYGKFPAGEGVREFFKNENGYDFYDELIWLVLDSPDGRHIRIRNDYYRTLNSIIVTAYRRNYELTRKLFAKKFGGIRTDLFHGIHATWHGEFCGPEDMPHGSMDLWKFRQWQSAAFTDIGGAERLQYPEGCPEPAYSLVLARSLSRFGPNHRIIYSNLWGQRYGTPDSDVPLSIVDYWRDFLDLFGARWIAHSYGYNGTIENDLGFGPGYPDHPAWDQMKIVNKREPEKEIEIEEGTSISDILMLFPLESFYAIGNAYANTYGEALVVLVDELTRNGYQVDIVNGELLSQAEIIDGSIRLNGFDYRALILPYLRVIPEGAWNVIFKAIDNGVQVIADLPDEPIVDISAHRLSGIDIKNRFDLLENPFDSIRQIISPTFVTPINSIGSIRKTEKGHRVRLIPNRPGMPFMGTFQFGEYEIEIRESFKPIDFLILD
ncbi:MAG: hypothetical protein ABIC40_07890 [bacterium]